MKQLKKSKKAKKKEFSATREIGLIFVILAVEAAVSFIMSCFTINIPLTEIFVITAAFIATRVSKLLAHLENNEHGAEDNKNL